MLTYIGDGKLHITGIPARDLSADEVEFYARRYELPTAVFAAELVARGLYSEVTPPQAVNDETESNEDGETWLTD